VDLWVVDSAGAIANTSLGLPLPPRLTLQVTVGVRSASPAGGSVTLSLALEISGGVAPFRVVFGAGGRAAWVFSVAADGPYFRNFTLAPSGAVDWSVACSDALGVTAGENGSLSVTPSSPPAPVPPGGPPASPNGGPRPGVPFASLAAASVVALAVVAITILGVRWWRRRRGADPPAPGPDPVGVLRRLIEPADGADRPTIELLAEEEGIPLPEVRATIDRLVADGTLLREVSPEGEEALSWADLGDA
jgi:hypothetical protein